MKKYCSVVRVLAHTQIRMTPLKQKKAHLMEIQVNGGSMADKVDFGYGLFEHSVSIDTIFEQDEMIDVIAVTKGHGFVGVTARWGTKRAAAQDPQGPAQGGLHRRLASLARAVDRCPRRSDGLPPRAPRSTTRYTAWARAPPTTMPPPRST